MDRIWSTIETTLGWSLIATDTWSLTVGRLLVAVLALAAAWLVGRWMPRLAQRLWSDPEQQEARTRTVLAGRAVCWLVGSILALESLGLRIQEALDKPLFAVAETDITVATLLTLAVLLWLAATGSKLVAAAVTRSMRRNGVDDAGTIAMVQRLVQYTGVVIAVAVGLQTVGIDLNAVIAAGTVFAVGLSFALQGVAQNFVSGLILIFERAIRPGDIIEVEGRVCRVITVGVRATHVITRDSEEVLVPNSVMVGNAVKSLTMTDRTYRIRVVVGLTYDTDVRKTRQVLEEVAESMPWKIPTIPIRVLCADFGASSVDWDVSVWTNDPWDSLMQGSMLREAIWLRFRDEGLVIAFPQLDVHFDPPVHAALKRVS